MAALNQWQTMAVLICALVAATVLGALGVLDSAAIERLVMAIAAGALGLGLPGTARRMAAYRSTTRTRVPVEPIELEG